MALILVFQNISDLAEVSDYKFEVLVGDGTPSRSRTIDSGYVRGHTRSEPYDVLVRKLIDNDGVER